MVKILVINGGSSSLKYTLFDMADESVLFEGIIDRIGLSGSTHSFGSGEEGARATVKEMSIGNQGRGARRSPRYPRRWTLKVLGRACRGGSSCGARREVSGSGPR